MSPGMRIHYGGGPLLVSFQVVIPIAYLRQ
jgi:hypothetical protein